MSPRLSLALEGGALRLPDEGVIAVFDPRGLVGLEALPRDRVLVVEPFFPDNRRWQEQGFQAVPHVAPGTRLAAALVVLPRSKAQARARLAEAAALTDGPVIVDGLKTHGVDSLMKDLRARADLSPPVAKAHGKLFWFRGAGVDLSDWAARDTRLDGLVTRPGVFSADAADPGSRLLAQALPRRPGARIADLGAGWGYLAAAVLTRDGVEAVHLVEADATALDCARAAIDDPRARFHWADATDWTPPAPLDGVVMNPPFHEGRAADAGLGRAFIAAAARILAPQGRLWMVANRHLPYEAALRDAFRDVTELPGDGRFKLFEAARPTRPRR
ncbi:MAG: methyltransferase domain-containing protein [Rhodobacteraceae bacterium]|nr:MAG: methyltransferase domain-containing protein [Paracoccaceae bacterium]